MTATKPDISVLVPSYNEGPNLPELILRLSRTFESLSLAGEIILIDDASTDDTLDRINALDLPRNIRVEHNQQNQGVLACLKRGVKLSTAPLIATLDADLQYKPEELSRLYREMRARNADIACGWRSPIAKQEIRQGWENRLFRMFLRILLGISLKDSRTGFLIARRDVFETILAQHKSEKFFHAFITSTALLLGFQVVEVEVWHEERRLGKNRFAKLSPHILIPLVCDSLSIWWRYRIKRRKRSFLDPLLKEINPPSPLPNESWNFGRRFWFWLYMVTFPLHHWMITRRSGKFFWELRRTQWATPEQIREYQKQKLQQLVRHAYRHVPYYREKMDSFGIGPEDIQDLEDIRKLPFLEKSDIRQNVYFDLLSDNHSKPDIYRINTSGSTGEPMIIYADRQQLELRWGATLRGQEWAGYRFGDRCARLWHQTIGMSKSQIFREKADAFFTKRLFIPAFEMSEENIHTFVSKLASWKPLFIDGYAESFNFLASFLKNRDLEGIRPRGMMSSAQMLPRQSREVIEKAFDCGVFDKYGSREFSGIAYECEQHNGHHIVSELFLVEVLKDGLPCQPGEVGEVVITDLSNYCMPLIRYRLGDLAEALDNTQMCACGRGAPRIGNIQGRTQAIILGTHGKYLPGTFFAHFFKDYDHIVRQYQILQEQEGSLKLLIVKGGRFSEPEMEHILQKLREFVGQDMHVELIYVDRIEMVRTGKHRAIISKIRLDLQSAGETNMITDVLN